MSTSPRSSIQELVRELSILGALLSLPIPTAPISLTDRQNLGRLIIEITAQLRAHLAEALILAPTEDLEYLQNVPAKVWISETLQEKPLLG